MTMSGRTKGAFLSYKRAAGNVQGDNMPGKGGSECNAMPCQWGWRGKGRQTPSQKAKISVIF